MTVRSFVKSTVALALLVGACMVFSQDNGGSNENADKQPTGPAYVLRTSDGGGVLVPTVDPVRDPGDIDITVNMTGAESWDAPGAPVNQILEEVMGTQAIMTGIGWDVTITTVGPSWLSEATIAFDNIEGGGDVFLTPGVADGEPGTGTYTNAVIDLTDNGLVDIPFSDGILYSELSESFDDVANAIDANYDSGSLTIRVTPGIEVPTLNEYGMLALVLTLVVGGLVVMRRRKKLSFS